MGGDAAICGASHLDVAVLFVVKLGGFAEANWRAGHSDGSRRRVELSGRGMGELAGAADKLRTGTANWAENRNGKFH